MISLILNERKIFSGLCQWRYLAPLLHLCFWLLAGFAIFMANSLEYPRQIALSNAQWLTLVGAISSGFLLPLFSNIRSFSWRVIWTALPLPLILAPAITALSNYLTFLSVGIDVSELQWVYFFQGSLQNGLIVLLWVFLFLVVRHRFAIQDGAVSVEGQVKNHTKSNMVRFKLSVESNGSILLIPLSEIKFFRSADDYVEVNCDNKQYLKRVTMNRLAKQLLDNNFVRIHRSTIVNMVHVSSFQPKRNGDFVVELNHGVRLPGSRRYKSSFSQVICDFDS